MRAQSIEGHELNNVLPHGLTAPDFHSTNDSKVHAGQAGNISQRVAHAFAGLCKLTKIDLCKLDTSHFKSDIIIKCGGVQLLLLTSPQKSGTVNIMQEALIKLNAIPATEEWGQLAVMADDLSALMMTKLGFFHITTEDYALCTLVGDSPVADEILFVAGHPRELTAICQAYLGGYKKCHSAGNPNDLLSLKEAAAIAGIKPETMQKHLTKKHLEAKQVYGYQIKRSDLKIFIRDRHKFDTRRRARA